MRFPNHFGLCTHLMEIAISIENNGIYVNYFKAQIEAQVWLMWLLAADWAQWIDTLIDGQIDWLTAFAVSHWWMPQIQFPFHPSTWRNATRSSAAAALTNQKSPPPGLLAGEAAEPAEVLGIFITCALCQQLIKYWNANFTDTQKAATQKQKQRCQIQFGKLN